jgi:oxidase EvaA
MEPGSGLQLSPTVQATPSNYRGAHNGAAVRYLDYFTGRRRVRVLADVLQSGHGSWFFRKASRNVIVEAQDDVRVEDGYCWLTLGQLGELMRYDDVVNQDTCAVLGCAPVEPAAPIQSGALHTDADLLSWFFAERARIAVRARRVPLRGVRDWVRGRYSIDHVHGRHFRIMAVAVRAGNREVPRWTQPLLEPVRRALAAFVLRRFDGVPHVLVQARAEGGVVDTVELGPTVQYTPDHYGPHSRPPFADVVTGAPADRVHFDAVLSEEGGRFYRAETRYLVVEADPAQAPDEAPPGFRWVTPSQLATLVHHGRFVNVQARALLAAINTRAAGRAGALSRERSF